MEEDTRLRRRKDASVVRPLYFLPLRVDVDVDARSPHPPDPTATTAESTLTLTLAGLRPRDTVRTVKELVEYKYGIPYAHQSIRGPVPSERELNDAQSLRRQGVVLGRIVLPGASQMQPEGNQKRTTHTRTPAASSRSSSGVLFSTTDVHLQYARGTETRIALGEDGAAGLGTAVDFVTLRTFRPLADYAEGGAYFVSQQQSRRHRHLALFVISLAVLAATFYVWWMVPYYKMPSPQAWMGRYEAGLKQAALYSRLRAEGMEPREVGLQADDAWRRGAQESSSSSSSADAAATLARLAAGEL